MTLERRLIIVTKLDSKRAKLEAVLRNGEPLPNVSPHDLRHTAGTLMLRRKMPVEVVKDSRTRGCQHHPERLQARSRE